MGAGGLPWRAQVVVRIDFGDGADAPSVRYGAAPEVVARLAAALAVWNPTYRVRIDAGPGSDRVVVPLPYGRLFEAG